MIQTLPSATTAPGGRRSARTRSCSADERGDLAPALIDALASEPACHLIAFAKRHDETVVSNIPWQDQPNWKWPGR